MPRHKPRAATLARGAHRRRPAGAINRQELNLERLKPGDFAAALRAFDGGAKIQTAALATGFHRPGPPAKGKASLLKAWGLLAKLGDNDAQ